MRLTRPNTNDPMKFKISLGSVRDDERQKLKLALEDPVSRNDPS